MAGLDLLVTWVSPSVTDLLGWSTADVVGAIASDLIHDEDAPASVVAMPRVLAGEVVRAEVRVRAADDSYRRVMSAVHGLFDAAGSITGLISVWSEIQPGHELARAWAEGESRYRLLAENASDALVEATPDGVITWVSPSITAMLGWAPSDLVGLRSADLAHPDDLPALAAGQARLATGEITRLDARLRTADGGFRWVTATVRPILDEAGNTVARVGGWRDTQVEHETRDALVESERRYRLLAEIASDVVCLVGPDRRVTWISPSVRGTLGWTVDDLMNTSMVELVHPDDRARIDSVREAVFAGLPIDNPVGGYESRFRCKDGSYRWMSLKATPLETAGGHVRSVAIGMRDVDALVNARQRAEEGQEMLRVNMDGVRDPVMLLRADRDPGTGVVNDFTCLHANQATCAYLSRSRDDLIGKGLVAQFPGLVESGLLSLCRSAIASDAPTEVDNFPVDNGPLGGARYYDVRAQRVSGDRLTVTWRDVTARHEAALAVAESEARFRLLSKHSGDVVVRSREGVIMWVSDSLTQALGWHPRDWIGRRPEDFADPDDFTVIMGVRASASDGTPTVPRLRFRARDGTYHWVEANVGPFTNAQGGRDGLVGSFRVIDHEVAAQRELEHLARFDALTGVLNRKEILQKLSGMSAAGGLPGGQAAVIFCDVDRFKEVNDTYGHAVGDEVLRAVAERISTVVRATDHVARIGGDELLVILASIRGIDDACAVAEKIRIVAAEPIVVADGSVTATLSLGATLIRPGEGVDALIARADAAMYEAKLHGRNQVVAID